MGVLIYIISLIIIILLGVLLVVSVPMIREKERNFKKTGKYPEGHYFGIGLSIGIPIGIPLGLAMGNIALGLPLGVAIGVAIGSGLESNAKEKGKVRSLTKKEKNQKSLITKILLISLFLGILAFGILFFFGGYF